MAGKGGVRPGSGRPKGSPNKATASIRDAAQAYTEDALRTLVEVMNDKEQPGPARVGAANAILDRGYGKPKQEVDGSLTGEMMLQILTGVPRAETD